MTRKGLIRRNKTTNQQPTYNFHDISYIRLLSYEC